MRSSPTSTAPEYVRRVGGIRSCSDASAWTMCEYTASFGFVLAKTSPACSGVTWCAITCLARSGLTPAVEKIGWATSGEEIGPDGRMRCYGRECRPEHNGATAQSTRKPNAGMTGIVINLDACVVTPPFSKPTPHSCPEKA